VLQTADYSTIVPIAVTSKYEIYVLDYFRKRVSPLALVEAIEAWYNRYHPRLTTIESTGYQEMLRQYLRTRIFIPGLELKEKPREAKSARLEMLQPFFAQKKVFIKKSQSDLYDELTMFPKAKNDDLLDGLYYAAKRIKPPVHTIPGVKAELMAEHIKVYIEYERQTEEAAMPTYYDPFA
jgi:predicted phage terminase large subunit-like protein